MQAKVTLKHTFKIIYSNSLFWPTTNFTMEIVVNHPTTDGLTLIEVCHKWDAYLFVVDVSLKLRNIWPKLIAIGRQYISLSLVRFHFIWCHIYLLNPNLRLMISIMKTGILKPRIYQKNCKDMTYLDVINTCWSVRSTQDLHIRLAQFVFDWDKFPSNNKHVWQVFENFLTFNSFIRAWINENTFL